MTLKWKRANKTKTIERIQTRVAFGWLTERLGEKPYARKLSRNQQPEFHPIASSRFLLSATSESTGR